MGCLIRSDSSYTWIAAETLKLLMEKHFTGHKKLISKQRRIEATGVIYQPPDSALPPKATSPQGVEWAMKAFELFETLSPDSIHLILL